MSDPDFSCPRDFLHFSTAISADEMTEDERETFRVNGRYVDQQVLQGRSTRDIIAEKTAMPGGDKWFNAHTLCQFSAALASERSHENERLMQKEHLKMVAGFERALSRQQFPKVFALGFGIGAVLVAASISVLRFA